MSDIVTPPPRWIRFCKKLLSFSRAVLQEASEGVPLSKIFLAYRDAFRAGRLHGCHLRMHHFLSRDFRHHYQPGEANLHEQMKFQANPHPVFFKKLEAHPVRASEPIKLIAIYETEAVSIPMLSTPIPAFSGHLQPRRPQQEFLPGADGLTLVEEISLARNYGLQAFSFVMSDGSTTALDDFLSTDTIDFEFCLTWRPSERCDRLAFQKILEKSQKNSRYLKTQGKPVVFIDGTESLGLPEVAELFLDHPRPPVAPRSTDFKLYDLDFEGWICSYAEARAAAAKNSEKISPVYCGWDESVDRGSRAEIWAGSTPALFAHWLHAACESTRNGMVVIRSWNDWRKSAVLLPDQHFGHSYLAAIRATLNRSYKKNSTLGEADAIPGPPSADTAVALHLFYPDLATDFAEALRRIGAHDLFISVCSDIAPDDLIAVQRHFPHANVFVLENRGRDVYPFWVVLSKLKGRGYKYILKLHSKKSPNTPGGDQWRRNLIQALTGDERKVADIKRRLEAGETGLICPRGYRLPYTRYRGLNHPQVMSLLGRLRVPLDLNGHFAAGTMFWIRGDIAEDLLTLELSKTSFEEENGQIDGTMAHALERAIPLYVEGRLKRPVAETH